VFHLCTVFSVLKPGVLSASGLQKWGSLLSAAVALAAFKYDSVSRVFLMM